MLISSLPTYFHLVAVTGMGMTFFGGNGFGAGFVTNCG
jgi:hypothetical protein